MTAGTRNAGRRDGRPSAARYGCDRRRFVTAFASALAAATLDVRAQQPGRLHRIGWLDLSSSAENLGVFVQAMSTRGWVEGKAFKLEYRGAEGRLDRLAQVAEELARRPVDLIVAPGTAEALAAKKATASIPVVMAGVDDPVGRGLVARLAHPGGNVTGLASARRELGGKLMSLLREQFPRAGIVGVLWDGGDPDHAQVVEHLRGAARALGMNAIGVEVRRHTEVETAITTLKKQGAQVLIVPASSILAPTWIADLARKNGLPLASTAPGFAYEGGLMAYADDWHAVFDRVATFVDRVLKGAKPGELPVELPTKFKLIVNAQTARALGIAIAPAILVRADYVID